jgi:hypothetical protein
MIITISEIYAKSLFKAVYAHIDGGGLIPPSPNPSGSGYSSPREQTAPAEWMRLFGPVTDYLVPPALMYDMIRGYGETHHRAAASGKTFSTNSMVRRTQVRCRWNPQDH